MPEFPLRSRHAASKEWSSAVGADVQQKSRQVCLLSFFIWLTHLLLAACKFPESLVDYEEQGEELPLLEIP